MWHCLFNTLLYIHSNYEHIVKTHQNQPVHGQNQVPDEAKFQVVICLSSFIWIFVIMLLLLLYSRVFSFQWTEWNLDVQKYLQLSALEFLYRALMLKVCRFYTTAEILWSFYVIGMSGLASVEVRFQFISF